MNKQSIIVLLLLITAAQAEMKCEAGKCSTGKEIIKKEMVKKEPFKDLLPTKPVMTKKRSEHRVTVKQLFNVRTTTVTREQIAHKQTNYGFIVAQEQSTIDVPSWYSGFVEELYADTLYTEVKEGDVLAKVYSPEVYKAKQDYLNSIKFNAKRPSHAMVKSSRIKLELLNVCAKEIEAIEKTQKVDRLTTIFAPASGWIFEKNINEGSSFSAKQKLFQIVNLDEVWMEVKLYQKDLAKLDTFQVFTVKVKGFNKTFEAKRSLLYPMLNPKEATATLRLEINNTEGILKPGMYATVSASASSASRLLIPRTAVIRKEGIWYAFLATEFKGEYEPIELKVKPLNAKYYELVSGLDKGDAVVDNALFMMDSDAQINSIY